MFRRINQGEFTENSNDKKLYLDKFIILNYDKYYFRKFKDYINFTNVAISVLPKTQIDDAIKQYFQKMLSMLSSMKSLSLNDFYVQSWKSEKSHYKILIDKVIGDFDVNYQIGDELFEKIDTQKIEVNKSDEEINVMEIIPYIHNIEEEYIEVIIPKSISKKYDFNIAGFVEVKTNDFYTDMFIEILYLMRCLKASINCIQYDCPITEEWVHVEIANAFNVIRGALQFLINSSSFKANKLFSFDRIEIDNRIDTAKSLVENALNLL